MAAGAMSEAEQEERWRRVAMNRRSQLGRRFGYAAVGCLFVGLLVDPMVGAMCFLLIAVSQVLDDIVWRPIAAGETDRCENSGLVLFSVVQSTLFYGVVPAALWTIDNAGVRAFSCLWLTGALLHVTMHHHQHRRIWLFSTIPHVVVFASLPLLSYLLADLPLSGVFLMLFGIGLYLTHMAGTFRLVNRKTNEIDRARREAERQREEAQRASEAKSAFLATMSHEIRTPLNGVIALAEALCTEDLPETSAHKAETIKGSGELLLQLLNDILDISKIESGRMELEEAPFDLKDLGRKIINLHTPKAREQGTELEIVIDEDVDPMRLGDEHRVLQILHNLVSNAIKFTENGRVTARITEDGRAGWIRVEVRDTGVGMSEAQVDKMLEPFTQADSSTTRRYGGTGLGLSIVCGIVDMMGGKIAIRSAPNEGTTITTALPMPVTAAPAQTMSPDTDECVADFSTLNVLAVDDNIVNRLVLTSLLAPLGAQTVLAESGEEAIAATHTQAFDVILMDISMPGMDGVEAMRRIRTAHGDKAPAIIAASAHALKHEVSDYLAQGFDGYLTKPMTRDALCRALRSVVTQAHPADVAAASNC